MYDPTIFENVKVAYENHVYDLDTIDKKIIILDRTDCMDFAILSREFAIQFRLVNQPAVTAKIVIQASVNELAGEIMGVPGVNLGCTISVHFTKVVQNATIQCPQIEQTLYSIWETDVQIVQTLQSVYGQQPSALQNHIAMLFKSTINEEHMADISELLKLVLASLKELARI